MTKDIQVLAIIPARGGSKSLPRKNIKLLLGKPLIAWTLDQANASKYITRTIVSTDDQEIAEVVKSYGAEVPFLRPAEISGDLSTDIEFLKHALDYLKAKEGYEPEIIIRLPPTSPLRTAEDIDNGIETLLKIEKADSSRPIVEASQHPYKMWKIEKESEFILPFLDESITNFKEPYNLPRQLFPKAYTQTGAMDVIRLKTIKEYHSTSGLKVAYFFMSPENSIDIDYPIDFEFAEFILNKRIKIN